MCTYCTRCTTAIVYICRKCLIEEKNESSHDYEWLSSCYFLTFFDRWGLSRVTNVHFFSLSSFCCLQWHCLKNKKRSRIKRKKKKKRELSLGLAAVLNAARVWIMTQNSSAVSNIQFVLYLTSESQSKS